MKTEQRLYVEQLKDGRFQYRLRYRDPKTGKTHRVSCIKPSNSKQNYNQALRELQDRAVSAFVSRPTLDHALLLYLEDKKRVLRPQTVIRNENEIRKVNDKLGGMYLDALTVLDVKRAVQQCSGSNTTYNERMARYKAFLNWCYQNELLQVNLADRLVKLPDNKKERIQDKYLEAEELKQLLDGMKVPMWYYLTYFMVLSGLRIGEVMALEVKDVGEYISVNKTFSLVTWEVGPAKTDNSDREVYVQPELQKLLDDYFIFRADYLKGRKSKLMFPGRNGSFLGYEGFNKYLKENSRRLIGREISTHALRHTSASLLIASGVPLETVARRLGHSDSRVTKEIYLHLTDRLRQTDNNFISQARILP